MSFARLEREIDSDDFPEPWEKIRKTLSTQSRITITGNCDRSGRIDREGGILESPRLRADDITRVVLWWSGVNPAFCRRDLAHGFARSDDRGPLDAVLSLITRSGGWLSPLSVVTRT